MLASGSCRNDTPLSYPLVLVDETVIATVGEAVLYIASLPPVYREWVHWQTASRTITRAALDPDYLQAATITLQTALLIDVRLSRPHLLY
jgi:hypothetical protein